MFSVVVPVYNKERTILRTINSVLSQNYTDFELIVIDDSSTDRSLEIVKSSSDPRIHVIESDRPGPGGYRARNLGIRKARFEWVTFLDADDQWLPHHLEELDRLRKLPNHGFLSTSWKDSWPDGRITRSGVPKTDRKDQTLNIDEFIKTSASYYPPVHTNTVAIKREILVRTSGFPEHKCRRGGDVVTWLNVILETKSILCSTMETAIYHREDSSVTILTAPELGTNCIYQDIREKINSEPPKWLKDNLQIFSNFHIRFALLFRFKVGILTLKDVQYLYFSVGKLEYLVFSVLSLLPGSAQKWLHYWVKRFIH
jgi:glycosyltransferase involved in cell wall biosynthesis